MTLASTRREFYLQDDVSNKFWTIELIGDEVVTTNGRIGAKPRETRTRHGGPDTAQRDADREVLAKRRKGYLECELSKVPAYQPDLPPRFVAINHDDYHAKYVGKTPDGGQFFLTFPFAQTVGDQPGGNFIALYLFDEFGLLRDAQVFDERAEGLLTQAAVEAFTAQLLAGLGKYKFGNIRVAPFAVERFGRVFGLVFDGRSEEDDDDSRWVNVLPGDYMAFYPPWDGDYDT